MGLLSFMLENAPTAGSIVSSDTAKRTFAVSSLEFNCKNKNFRELFPDLVELNDTFLAVN
jgi:ubiquitin-conjugating enzyme E2 J2